jgi:serine/threonine-protein kinase HipA
VSDPVEVYVQCGDRAVQAGVRYSHRGRGTESATFTYVDRYVSDPDAYALDPSLPVGLGRYQTPLGRSLFAAFSDGAPDRWGRTLLQQMERRWAVAEGTATRSLGEVDLLLGVRDDLRQGALRLRTAGPFLAVETDGVPAMAQLPELLDLTSRAEQAPETVVDAELRRLVHAGSSLGGARPKAHVMAPDGNVAIAKFPSRAHDTWDVMAWEKVALDLAGDSGIGVPPSQLVRIAGRSVLVIERFDRRDNERIGYVSAMTMLEATDGEQHSYLEIADVIETRSLNSTDELAQLWRRIAFSCSSPTRTIISATTGFCTLAAMPGCCRPHSTSTRTQTPGPSTSARLSALTPRRRSTMCSASLPRSGSSRWRPG